MSENNTNKDYEAPQYGWIKSELAKLDDVELPEDFAGEVEQKLKEHDEKNPPPVFGVINEDDKVAVAKKIAYILIPLAAAFVLIVGLSLNSLKSELPEVAVEKVFNPYHNGQENGSSGSDSMKSADVNNDEMEIDDNKADKIIAEREKKSEGGRKTETVDNHVKDGNKDEVDFSKKLIYTADFVVVIEDYEVFDKEIRQKVRGLGGYVELSDAQVSSIYYRGKEQKNTEGFINMRVPVEGYSELLSYIAENTEVKRQSENVVDVTSHYKDLEQSIRNYEAKEEALRAMMKDAKTVEESLDVFELLSQTRNTIDSYKGELKGLDNRVNYTTINLSFSEKEKAEDIAPIDDELGTRISDRFKASVNSITTFFENIIVVLAGNSPVYLLVILCVVIVGLITVAVVKKVLSKNKK